MPTDRVQAALDRLQARRASHMSRPVVYRRGSASVEVYATIGSTTFQITDAQGVMLESTSRDYLIPAASLIIEGNRVDPRAGDQITESVDGRESVYEVMPFGPEPAWRFSDRYGKMLRIHTKLVSMGAPA